MMGWTADEYNEWADRMMEAANDRRNQWWAESGELAGMLRYAAKLVSTLPAPTQGWQDIATAPEDGTKP